MHHVDDFEIDESPTDFRVSFAVAHSGAKVLLTIPKVGLIENSDREVTWEQVNSAAHHVGTVLSQSFVSQNLKGYSG